MSWRRLAGVLRGTHHGKPPDAPQARMVREQIRSRGIRDQRVLDVMSGIDRRLFVPRDHTEAAFEDHPISIGHGQTISQPYIVGAMTELLELEPGHPQATLMLGRIYEAQKKLSPALQAYQKALERHPTFSEAFMEACETALGLPIHG